MCAGCFTRDNLLASDWYGARLAAKQKIDRRLWRQQHGISGSFSENRPATRMKLRGWASPTGWRTREKCWSRSNRLVTLRALRGTLGAEPIEAYL